MKRVQNKTAIRRLSLRMVREGKKKCLPGICAILLTSVLFTALFTIGGSLLGAYQDAVMRKMGSSAMAGVKFVRQEDFEKLSNDPAVAEARYRILLGVAKGEAFQKLSTEVSYATDEEAASMFCAPTEGKMPTERLEIATSTLVLQALGVPCRLGETVPMAIDLDGKVLREDFTLSGYWEGNAVASAQQCWVSRPYCEEVAPAPGQSFYQLAQGKYAGYWMVDFDYANAWDLEGKTRSLLERNGYGSSRMAVSVSSAYGFGSVDPEAACIVAGMLCLIMASGYLIIYNVFALNVVADIQSYGLLKTIGTTGKQLKKLVRGQALLLSAAGIPGGLLLGALLGAYLLPAVAGNLAVEEAIEVSLHPVIFLAASCFSFCTVWASCRKPCRLASKVSPVEAVRYVEAAGAGSQRERRRRKVTAASFARANIRRNPRKVAVVTLSLSLSLVLLNSVYALVCGFDMGKYMSHSLVGDAMVSDASIFQADFQKDTSGVSEEMQKELAGLEGVAESHLVYSSDSYMKFDAASQQRALRQIREETSYLEDSPEDGILQLFKDEGLLMCQLYGLDEWAASQVQIEKGEMDWGKFQTGDYIVLNSIGLGMEKADPLQGMYYDVGDTVSMELPDGSVKDYQVMAIGGVPYAMTSRFSYYLNTQAVLPGQEYLAHAKEKGALFQVLTAGEGQGEELEQSLAGCTENDFPALQYVSRKSYEKEFADYIQMYWIVGGSLSFILALIGLLNFTNGMAAEILARRKEFAMMEAVGMTGRQLKSMLAWEGGFYAVSVSVCSLALSTVLNCTLLKSAGGIWFYESHFTLLPLAVCIPVLGVISCVVPIWVYRKLMRQAVVERLRE